LDYSFDVLISRIGNLDLYNWFYHIYFTYCPLPALVCLCSRHDFQYMIFNSNINTCVFDPARHLALILPLVGLLLTTLYLHVQVPKLGAWWTSVHQSYIAVASWIAVDQSEALSFHPPAHSRVFLS